MLPLASGIPTEYRTYIFRRGGGVNQASRAEIERITDGHALSFEHNRTESTGWVIDVFAGNAEQVGVKSTTS